MVAGFSEGKRSKVKGDGDHQAMMQELVKKILSKDYFEEIELVMKPKWFILTIIKELG